VRILILEKQIKAMKPRRPFRSLLLLAASDILLAIGTRIRPKEFQAYNGRSIDMSKG